MQLPPTPKGSIKDSKSSKRCSGETRESSKAAVKSKDKHKRTNGKHPEHPHVEKVTGTYPSNISDIRMLQVLKVY